METKTAVSECKSHVWDGITCKNCKVDIFDLYYDLRGKLAIEKEESERYRDELNCQKDSSSHLSRENILLRRELEELKQPNKYGSVCYGCKQWSDWYDNLKQERDELFPKLKQLESQVAVMHGVLEELKAYAVRYRKTWPSSRFIEIHQDNLNKVFESLQTLPAESVGELQELEKYAELGRLVVKGANEVMSHTVCKGIYKSDHCKVINSDHYGCVLKYYCQVLAEVPKCST